MIDKGWIEIRLENWPGPPLAIDRVTLRPGETFLLDTGDGRIVQGQLERSETGEWVIVLSPYNGPPLVRPDPFPEQSD